MYSTSAIWLAPTYAPHGRADQTNTYTTMAKNNIFLGTGAGSVGDVTMMRRMGKQVSRLRVRTIANPKTYGQARQRCYMAPIPKFYAPLAIALEKSWEGKNKSQSYSEFIKKNVELARTNNWTLPKGTAFFPMPYRLSKGTLPSINAELSSQGSSMFSLKGDFIELEGDSTFGAFSRCLINSKGLQNGDQITIISVIKVDDNVFIPKYVRFYLDITSEVDFDSYLEQFGLTTYNVTSNICTLSVMNPFNGLMGEAVIASRWENDMWRRSIESLDVAPEILAAISGAGVDETNIASYMPSSQANPSDVYLNGSAT